MLPMNPENLGGGDSNQEHAVCVWRSERVGEVNLFLVFDIHGGGHLLTIKDDTSSPTGYRPVWIRYYAPLTRPARRRRACAL
jgi:hypothetical protein